MAEKYKNIEAQSWDDINIEELENALKKSQKWTSPGIDKVTNYWLHHMFSEIFERCEPDKTPRWFAEGITYLLAKTTETRSAKNHRPVTCLSTTHKNSCIDANR